MSLSKRLEKDIISIIPGDYHSYENFDDIRHTRYICMIKCSLTRGRIRKKQVIMENCTVSYLKKTHIEIRSVRTTILQIDLVVFDIFLLDLIYIF